jgi:hypothetical protein
MVCRNEQRGQEAAAKVRETTGNNDVHLAVSGHKAGTPRRCDELLGIARGKGALLNCYAVICCCIAPCSLVCSMHLWCALLVQAGLAAVLGCVPVDPPEAAASQWPGCCS